LELLLKPQKQLVVLSVLLVEKRFMPLKILESLPSLTPLLMWRFYKSLVAAVVVCTMEVVVEQEDCYTLLVHQ
tara:strand:+ start:77 stop:295 length:219 start_codon:yes stop_codon:yes gene_type:complete